MTLLGCRSQVDRCRVLEQSGCASVCVNCCKIPTQARSADAWHCKMRASPFVEPVLPGCTIFAATCPPRRGPPCRHKVVHQIARCLYGPPQTGSAFPVAGIFQAGHGAGPAHDAQLRGLQVLNQFQRLMALICASFWKL